MWKYACNKSIYIKVVQKLVGLTKMCHKRTFLLWQHTTASSQPRTPNLDFYQNYWAGEAQTKGICVRQFKIYIYLSIYLLVCVHVCVCVCVRVCVYSLIHCLNHTYFMQFSIYLYILMLNKWYKYMNELYRWRVLIFFHSDVHTHTYYKCADQIGLSLLFFVLLTCLYSFTWFDCEKSKIRGSLRRQG